MAKREEFIQVINAFKAVSTTITDNQRRGLLQQAVQVYDLSIQEGIEILDSLGIVVGDEINHFDILGLSLEEIQGMDNQSISDIVRSAHDNLYKASLTAGARIRSDGKTEDQWRMLLNQARDILDDIDKRNEYISILLQEKSEEFKTPNTPTIQSNEPNSIQTSESLIEPIPNKITDPDEIEIPGRSIWNHSFLEQIRRKYDLTPPIVIILSLTILFFLVFLIYPLLYVFKEAFWIENTFNLHYFKLMVTDPNIRKLVINSFNLGVMVTIMTSILSLPLAYFLTRYRFPGRNIFRSIILIPMIMPPFVGALGMMKFFGNYGSVNLLLQKLHILSPDADPINWFGSGFWGVVLLSTLHLYPIMYLNIVAALSNVDPSLEEAAENLGSSRFQIFRNITLPLMMPGYFAGAILVFIWSFTDLGTPLIFNYNDVIAVRIFRQVQDANQNPMGYALVVLIIVLTAFAFYASKKWTGTKHYEMLGRGHVTSREVDVKWSMRSIIYIFIGGLTFIALLPHLSVILASLTRSEGDWNFTILPKSYTFLHYSETFTHADTLPSILNSLKYSICSTVVALIVGVVIAYLLTRKKLPFQNLIDAIAMLPLALPGVAIAFGYMGSFSNTSFLLRNLPAGLIDIIDPRKNPTILLIISYAVRRLPYMLRSIYAGFQQTSIAYEEASQNMGATPVRTLYKITLPLVFANILAGAILVFSFSMLEVSDSLILAQANQYYPITKAIWSLSQRLGDGPYIASALGVVGMFILIGCLLGAGRVLGGKLGEIFRI